MKLYIWCIYCQKTKIFAKCISKNYSSPPFCQFIKSETCMHKAHAQRYNLCSVKNTFSNNLNSHQYDLQDNHDFPTQAHWKYLTQPKFLRTIKYVALDLLFSIFQRTNPLEGTAYICVNLKNMLVGVTFLQSNLTMPQMLSGWRQRGEEKCIDSKS